MKIISTVKLLNCKYGGNWEYDKKADLWKNKTNENEFVFKVSRCTCDDICVHGYDLYLYGRGNPILINFN